MQRISNPMRQTLNRAILAAVLAGTGAVLAPSLTAAPKNVIISLDGMTPRFVNAYLQDGTLSPNSGIGRLISRGTQAQQNLTISPSLTAPGHIAIATGSIAAHNDVMANTFHLVASPFTSTISGFGAPIGGYTIDGPAESPLVTALPMWIMMRKAGRTVVTATWPGGDGVDVKVPGAANNAVVQPANERTVDYTVPFGAATSPFQRGFVLNAANFSAAPAQTIADLTTAGHPSFSPVLQASLESFTNMGVTFTIKAAALDTTNDGTVNYDTIVIYNVTQGILGPFTPAPLGTGPAYIKPGSNISALFLLEGNTLISSVAQKAGVRYFVSSLTSDLSTVRIARTSVTYIGRQFIAASATQVLADADDINANVGFWQPQPDFRIVEKLDAVPSTFANFPDLELESIYEELVKEFAAYQTRVAIRAINQKPNADLVMTYIEQPDGSFHQFLLTDPRQPTDYSDKNSIGAGQNPAKIARYQTYLRAAYKAADKAVEDIIQAAGGVNGSGRPNANIFVVSDHGFAPFHTAVNMGNLLTAAGFSTAQVRPVTSGPAANVYISLQGREPNGTVTPAQFRTLQAQIVSTLNAYLDANPTYALTPGGVAIFDKVYARPLPAADNDPTFGRLTDNFIGQDSGDVYALLKTGYNFDGAQTPVINRQGDPISASPVLSLPNFYGAHGYDPTLPEMSAVFCAAGPDIAVGTLAQVRNVDVAPTLSRMLGVASAATVDGSALALGIQVTRGGYVLNRRTGRYSQQLTLQNIGTTAVTGPLNLVLDSLSSNASLFNQTGVTASTIPAGSSYITVPTGGDSVLSPGESTSVILEFTNPTRAAITYTTREVTGTATP